MFNFLLTQPSILAFISSFLTTLHIHQVFSPTFNFLFLWRIINVSLSLLYMESTVKEFIRKENERAIGFLFWRLVGILVVVEFEDLIGLVSWHKFLCVNHMYRDH
ncbi:hypothetical protein Syun_020910 [Stephania yunnanensis]|uniref:Uncharacterized protein n=1 Tax=Stephania yunnanensis TaxID=152371 RepID=A0AAP0NPB0_9MAGN